jgi:hypothetical protein
MLDELPQSNPIHQIKNEMGLNVGEDGFVHVYTDGACSQNGQKGAKAGYGVWWAKGICPCDPKSRFPFGNSAVQKTKIFFYKTSFNSKAYSKSYAFDFFKSTLSIGKL